MSHPLPPLALVSLLSLCHIFPPPWLYPLLTPISSLPPFISSVLKIFTLCLLFCSFSPPSDSVTCMAVVVLTVEVQYSQKHIHPFLSHAVWPSFSMASSSKFHGASGNLRRVFEKNQKRYADLDKPAADRVLSPAQQRVRDIKQFSVKFLHLMDILYNTSSRTQMRLVSRASGLPILPLIG